MEILSFFTGVLYFYTKSKLALVAVLLLALFRPKWTLLLAFILAYTVSAGHQWWTADQGMPLQSVINQAQLEGVIASIPSQTQERTKFEFEATALNGQPMHARLNLACYQHCPNVQAGQVWRCIAKLHQIHNLNNPGGFDYKTLLEARHIHWTGYVLHNSLQLVELGLSKWSLLALRDRLSTQLATIVKEEDHLGVIQALTVGVTSHISQDLWGLFRRTGTTHLMVISGAHIGLIAGMMFQLVSYLWSRSKRLCLRYPAPKIASIAAIIFGFAYALLAGFGVPAERATVASLFIFLRYLSQKQFGVWQAWHYALVAVLVSEPHAVLMPGFYLSFMAVAILLTMNRRLKSTGWRKAVGIQLSCLLGLLPFTLFWFSYGAVNGLLANIVAIPWVSFVIVPLALLSVGLGQSMTWLMVVLKWAIGWLLLYLHWVDTLAGINISLTYVSLLMPLAWMLGMLVIVLLPLKSMMPLLASLWIAVWYSHHPGVKSGEFEAHILDVGQGLAVVIRTHTHTLIYDTGGQIYHGSDMGKLVLIPYLKTLGIRGVDRIVISHPDLDHRGGLASVESQYPIGDLVVDDPSYYHRGLSCHDLPDWHWDGVVFHFFSIRHLRDSHNNRSCVLQLSNQAGKLLLTGDIEKEAEQDLVKSYGPALQSLVMVVPHHGSKTSSTRDFITAVAPQYAILSYGFDNRYHFPHASVLMAYRHRGTELLATAEQGMISAHFKQQGLVILPFSPG